VFLVYLLFIVFPVFFLFVLGGAEQVLKVLSRMKRHGPFTMGHQQLSEPSDTIHIGRVTILALYYLGICLLEIKCWENAYDLLHNYVCC